MFRAVCDAVLCLCARLRLRVRTRLVLVRVRVSNRDRVVIVPPLRVRARVRPRLLDRRVRPSCRKRVLTLVVVLGDSVVTRIARVLARTIAPVLARTRAGAGTSRMSERQALKTLVRAIGAGTPTGRAVGHGMGGAQRARHLWMAEGGWGCGWREKRNVAMRKVDACG